LWAARVVKVIEPPLMVWPEAAERVTVLVDHADAVTLQTWNNSPSERTAEVDEIGVLMVVEFAGWALTSSEFTAAVGAMVPEAEDRSWYPVVFRAWFRLMK
jgi:hypothetical protein